MPDHTFFRPLGLFTRAAQVHSKIEALRPYMESHFELTLGKLYETRCLIYRPGDFFELHIDSVSRVSEEFSSIAARQVSIVIFLNDPNNGVQSYTGGIINFHGLMDVPGSSAFGFPLDPETGLLVAFRSTILHGVTAVEEGKR
jgi:predicted 2-oxoglutarate/Fe(II)-dependent dioxygenase YbiX